MPGKAMRKRPAERAKPAGTARPAKRIARGTLIERRDRCMAEIIQRASADAQFRFLRNARQLLTRHWWPSSWRARADLVRTAEWLLGVQNGAAPGATAGAAPPRRPDGSRPS